MEFFMNVVISIIVFIVSMFFITLVHEVGHYFVARGIMKEPNVKINMGFFGKPLINTKRFWATAFFFFGGYVGGYSDGEARKSHMIMLFSVGAVFTILLGIPIALYVSGGNMSIGDFIGFLPLPRSPIREDFFSVPFQANLFTVPWLSFSAPLDFFNAFMLYLRNMVGVFVFIAIIPYAYPLKLHGKWHWNPSDGLWVLKFLFNKVSEADMENAAAAINEKTDNK